MDSVETQVLEKNTPPKAKKTNRTGPDRELKS